MLAQHRSPHVLGVEPRSLYASSDEAAAWRAAVRSALWRPTPTFLYANRRVVGVTAGRYFDDRVACVRFRRGTPWSHKLRARDDLLHANWNNGAQLTADLFAGQAGRTAFEKSPSTTPVAGNWYDWWPVGGNPVAGSILNTAFTAAQFSETTTGAITHRGNVSTNTKNLLSIWAAVVASTTCPVVLMLYDRVLAYDQCTFNASASQSMTNTLAAQRYVSGAPGMLIMIVSATVQGATAANLTTLTYTNQAGTPNQVMPTTTTVTFIPSAAAASATLGSRVCVPSTSGGTTPWTFSIPLAAGDIGAQLVANYTTSAANTGTFSIVMMHPLADLILPVNLIPVEKDVVFQSMELERIYDGACLALAAFQATATGINMAGGIKFGWGSH